MTRIRRIRKRKIEHVGRRTDAATDAVLPSRPVLVGSESGPCRVVVIGSAVFNIKLVKLLENETDLQVVATTSTQREALATPKEFRADLAIIEVDFGGTSQGILLARTIGERNPGCAIMLVCGAFTDTVAQHIWVYGTEWWSIISSATAKSPAHVAEAVSSAVHGMTWIEPGVKRVMAGLGPRPRSIEERRQVMFDDEARPTAA